MTPATRILRLAFRITIGVQLISLGWLWKIARGHSLAFKVIDTTSISPAIVIMEVGCLPSLK